MDQKRLVQKVEKKKKKGRNTNLPKTIVTNENIYVIYEQDTVPQNTNSPPVQIILSYREWSLNNSHFIYLGLIFFLR